ncbi:MAG: sulfatase-like hydrolase/transferase [Deltaproteobacteria bacterium]|nr:sulfatase-like hydrolase/transferase [Deltaproteobacteria bacterium]
MFLSFAPLLALMACADPRPSILLVTLDTTRADRLGPYGYMLAQTPTLDALAAQGVVYTRAYATCPLTIPSHASLFTGRTPPSHGVRDNGDYVLPETAITLAERFAEAGWRTAAFTAAFPTQARWGLNQGFERYHDPLRRLPTQLDWSDQRAADEVITDALATLPGLAKDGEPLFVWVHLFDAHWPYEPPEPALSAHPGRPYDGEITFADAELGRLIAWFDEARPGGVVVITADHGEGLGDGGERTHGFLLHDGTVRVPLIVRAPGLTALGRVDDPVSHIDVAPTLLNLAGLPLHDGLQGADLREGGSERPYSEALTGQLGLGLAPMFAYTDEAGRYMEGGWGAFYPAEGERVSTSARAGDTTAEAATLAAIRAGMEAVATAEASLSAEELLQLSALGYLGGDADAPAGVVDPRDVIGVIPLTWEARRRLGQGQLNQAEALIVRLEAEMPGTYGVALLRAQLTRAQGKVGEAAARYTDLYLQAPSSTLALQLADFHAAWGDWRGAEGWYQSALDHQPMSPEALRGLVESALKLGEPERAEELALDALALYPDHAEVGLMLAALYLRDGRAEEALAESSRALVLMPRSVWALSIDAEARWALGQADLSIERLQDALLIDRLNLPLRLRLAAQLLEIGRNAEAVRALGPYAAIFPESEELGALLAAAQRALVGEVQGG